MSSTTFDHPTTANGDSGQTSLADGRRVPKNDVRIEACGALDELNSHIGFLLAAGVMPEAEAELHDVQRRLFALGALAAGVVSPQYLPDAAAVRALEPPLERSTAPRFSGFVLPGGCEAAARAHICRAVCRRAERRLLSALAEGPQTADALRYLNRLSAYFFSLSRQLNIFFGAQEIKL